VKEHNLVAQIMTRGRGDRALVAFNDAYHQRAQACTQSRLKLMFKNAKIGAALLMPAINWLDQINAQKDFNLTVDGPEYLTTGSRRP